MDEVELDGFKSKAVSCVAACWRYEEGKAGKAAGRAVRVVACTCESAKDRPLLKDSQTCPASCVRSPSSESIGKRNWKREI